MKILCYCLISGGVLGLVLAAPAQAQTTAGQGTYGQLAALSDQIAILKAQAQIAQLQKEIITTKRETDLVATSRGSASSYPPGATPIQMPAAPSDDEPHVISIAGRGWRLSAFLIMSNGAQIQVVPGTVLANGAMVQSISPDSVKVLQDGRIYALPFSGAGMSSTGLSP